MRIVFIGTGEIGVPTLRALLHSIEHDVVAVVTQPDKRTGRHQQLQPPPIKIAHADRKMPILQPPRIKDSEAVKEINAFAPDAIVVLAYGQILPREILTIPRLACLNLHASLLPQHRGAAPVQAAIAAGDSETGITVMYMDEGLDTGDVLLQHKIDILQDDTGGSLHDRLAEVAPDALLQALELLEKGNAPRIPQDSSLASYAPKLEREHGKIDWNEPADVIERKVRAFNPWPGAFTNLRDGSEARLKIFGAKIVDGRGPAGKIICADRELIIATSDRSLSLIDLQLEGKKRMSASELIRGSKWIASAEVL